MIRKEISWPSTRRMPQKTRDAIAAGGARIVELLEKYSHAQPEEDGEKWTDRDRWCHWNGVAIGVAAVIEEIADEEKREEKAVTVDEKGVRINLRDGSAILIRDR